MFVVQSIFDEAPNCVIAERAKKTQMTIVRIQSEQMLNNVTHIR